MFSNIKLSKDFIDRLLSDFVSKYELQDYVKSVNYKVKLPFNASASYSPSERSINLNLRKYENSFRFKSLFSSSNDEVINSACEYYAVGIIYHELVHALQLKMMNDRYIPNAVKIMFRDSNKLQSVRPDLYNDFHDIFVKEHHAAALSAFYLDDYVSNCTKYGNLLPSSLLVDSLLKEYYFEGNNLVSPIERFYFKYFRQFDSNSTLSFKDRVKNYINNNILHNDHEFSELERLLFGLPICLSTYNELKDMAKSNSTPAKVKSYIINKK